MAFDGADMIEDQHEINTNFDTRFFYERGSYYQNNCSK
jgi:hypothetical protein